MGALGLAEMELVYFLAAYLLLCSRVATKTVLLTHHCFKLSLTPELGTTFSLEVWA